MIIFYKKYFIIISKKNFFLRYKEVLQELLKFVNLIGQPTFGC